MSTLILASELAQLYRHTLHRNRKAQADERLNNYQIKLQDTTLKITQNYQDN